MQTPSRREPVVEKYARLAGSYDRKWSFYIQATTRETIARLPLRAEDRLLDIGCGTGALLHRFSARHPASHVVGNGTRSRVPAAIKDRKHP